MTENNLFQLAQLVTELPILMNQQQNQDNSSSSSSSYSLVANLYPNSVQQSLAIRKNACIVCAVCFTCSGYYGMNCKCSEIQPRRGKNLPEGGLDSRAKKLSSNDKDDYEFTLQWLNEYAHEIYRDKHHQIIKLPELKEVSLCKAHSSALYRAKKKFQRNMMIDQTQAPPSPADSSSTVMMEDVRMSSSLLLPQPPPPPSSSSSSSSIVNGGALAAKIREVSSQYTTLSADQPSSADFSTAITASTSTKRRRTVTKNIMFNNKPNSSASTPLLYSSNNNDCFQHSPQNHPLLSRQFTPKIKHSLVLQQQQLPPLHVRTFSSNNTQYAPNLLTSPTRTAASSPFIPISSSSSSPFLQNNTAKVIETVSLKGSPSLNPNYYKEGDIYYIRNLAITDTFTFQDLLSEIDFAGSPPPGKKVIISDLKRERIFPLRQAIRSVFRYPKDTHVEFYLDLSEKPSIDWNNYK
ncbi:uncharacterized protein BX663DRAFT_550293 [Cokeromyces recurvatus]|uniref:uncharacterized protein n=1 Tax=Cokeromyces recurvatus TaxID=90255 RepID=UPI0022208941|nr:uncharacterized protein BX663DRAFT_550293 [Cokeromyces recurvatus]KAI7904636.1 hypothetical protein BX663DRAFT_550293 [Cokeromyces recurvatus]